MNKYRLIAFFFLFSASILTITAQNVNAKKFDQLIESKIEKGIVPGIAVGIVQNGKLTYEKYVGYANLEHEVKIDEKSRFNIASNAKQYTALCILQLVLEGKLQLENDFRKYLPGYFPNIKEAITISQLLTHTSGIRDAYDLMSIQGTPWWRREGLDNDDALNLLKAQKELNFEPGSDYLYSNSNYILLTEIVKKTSGTSFNKYATALFKGFQMNDSQFSTNYMAVIPHKTLPYTNWGDGIWQQWPMITNLHGDGFLYTTLRDQLNWEKILQNKKLNDQPLGRLIESQLAISDAPVTTYGFGVELNTYKGYEAINHEGGTGSYSAQFFRFPSQNLAIVVMSNNGSVWSGGLARELADILLDISDEKEITYPAMPERIESKPKTNDITGSYQLENDGTIIKIVEKGGALYREIYNRDPVQLIHQEGNVFYYETFKDLKMVFTKNKKGSYDFTLYQPTTAARLAPRLSDERPKDFLSLNGNYFNEEIDVKITLDYKENDRYLVTTEKGETEARLILKDYLQTNNYVLKGERDEMGNITALLLDYNRVKNLRFYKDVEASISQTQKTEDGGRITVTTTKASYGKGKGDILLTKTNSEGNEEWFNTYGGSSYDLASSVQITNDGGYIIVGSTSSFGKGNYDVWLIKTDAKGKEQWNKTYGGFYNEYGYTVKQTQDGGYVIKGKKQLCPSQNSEDCLDYQWLIKTDNIGIEISNKTTETFPMSN